MSAFALKNLNFTSLFHFQLPYFYAISVFNGRRKYKLVQSLSTGQDVCSLIACTELNDWNSCGKRYAANAHFRYSINKLTLKATLPASYRTKIMPNSLTSDLMPLNVTDFDYEM